MRHVMALRVSKAVLVFAIALFYTILVLNNITDYGSNYEFVRHVLMMDSTPNSARTNRMPLVGPAVNLLMQ